MSLPNGPYNPQENDKQILNYWLENKFYKPEYSPSEDRLMSTEEMKADVREAWALICPPPNAYARPHLGNISGYAYQDVMARYARMQGKKVLVLPGKDHAGLEGEGVFVREVLEKQGRNKFDINREDFYSEMMEFFMKNIDIARNDEKTIGLSADFDRDTFTLDPVIVDTVLDTFVEMYKEGKIYKGVRIVNWDPKARTAVADNQVEYKESQTPFFYFKYSFLKPEQKAIELKNEYTYKDILWKVQQSDEKKSHLLGETHKGVNVLGIGYDKVPADNEVNGVAIGIQMRLDGNFALVVKGIDFDGDINAEIIKVETELFTQVAGSNIIQFSEYTEDKFYTNAFVIGTVRPETIFADTAIACDPKDERYKHYVGKKIEVEFLGEKKTLNFIEDYAVDKDFGTGLLKVTPAHSVEDWEIAQRHPEECLPAIQVIGYDLRLNKLTGKYNGLGIKDARKVMIDDMKIAGNLVYVDETYQNKIKIAERTKAAIEPLLSSQWYLKYEGIREAAVSMVKDNQVTIHPENMVKKFDHWMENLRDWAISRSLWWGYRLPVWYAGKVFEEIDDNGQVKEYIAVNGAKEELDYKNSNHLKVQKENPGEGWIQDENVLDTWFSSGQWVYATLNKYNLMDTFFPTNVMVSGHDILENWDSRMMMFTYFKSQKYPELFKKTYPFDDLYLIGLVLGGDGQKMSKSKGNLIDMDKVALEYGIDALRMAYFYQNSAGASYVISNDKLKNFKQFNNKIWNAARFVFMNTKFDKKSYEELNKIYMNGELHPDIELIYLHIKLLKEKVKINMDKFEFGYATESLYEKFWHEFCDEYIETSKQYFSETSRMGEFDNNQIHWVMMYTLKEYLKMLHPFIPFITEKIWQETPKVEGDHKTLMYSKW